MPRDREALLAQVRAFMGGVKRTVLLMVGVPDYQRYVLHCQTHHPDRPVMTYEAFFRNRQECRYGGDKMGRCC